jgi:heavy metal sensor kinase
VTLREVLGAEFSDQLFQLVEPDGTVRFRSSHLRGQTLPLTAVARDNAAGGRRTFETVVLGRQRLRLLTLPVGAGERPSHLVQAGLSLGRSQRALSRYLESLVVLVPLSLGLAASGGAVMARAALRPVDEMSRTARRITAEALARRIDVRGTGDELDRLADTLNGMLGRLEAAFAALRRFSADAAHELRTPLTVLKGGLEVALRADRSAEDYRRVLGSSLEEVDRLVRLAEDLLLLSRATAGLEGGRRDVDLASLALDVLEVAAGRGRAAGVVVRLDRVTPVTVHGDAQALRRAALNIVDNAVKYTPPGGRVAVSVERADGHACLVVEDTGPGIAPADAARVFEPFVRLDAARAGDAGGAGLGLAIARSIAVAHGGALTLESPPAGGCRFVLRLPVAAGKA